METKRLTCLKGERAASGSPGMYNPFPKKRFCTNSYHGTGHATLFQVIKMESGVLTRFKSSIENIFLSTSNFTGKSYVPSNLERSSA